MRVAVTGTPGTGKTTATRLLESPLEVIHLNDVIEAEELYDAVDEDRGSWIADLDAVATWLDGRDDVVVESHLAHRFDADRVIVLRCRPDELRRRLRERGADGGKAAENAEAEALDVILAEAVADHGEDRVYEIDTTDRSAEDVAAAIDAVIGGERDPSAGAVDFTDHL